MKKIHQSSLPHFMAARSLYRGRGSVDYLQGKVYVIMWNVSWDFTWLSIDL